MALLTDDDRAHFEKYGYVVVEDVVPEEKCEAVIEDIYEFTGRDPDDPDTWYQPPEGLDEQFSSVGGLEMYNTQSMWDTRQDETLYQAFAEILEEEHLWVSIDRTNMTPPADEDHPEILIPVGERVLRSLAFEYTTRSPGEFDIDRDHATPIRGRGFELVALHPDPDEAQREAFLAAMDDLMDRDYRQTKGRRGR